METETVTEAAPEVAAEVVETPNTETPAAPEVKAFDPATIPKEIQEYFGKQKTEYEQKFADYEKHQKAAQEWEGVRNDPRFRQFAESLHKPPEPKPFEITDEQFTAARAVMAVRFYTWANESPSGNEPDNGDVVRLRDDLPEIGIGQAEGEEEKHEGEENKTAEVGPELVES